MDALIKRGAVAGAVIGGLVLGAAASAGADPKVGDVFDLTCGGTTTEVVVNGRGNWTPAHATDGNAMFIPTAFGDFHGTVLDTDGNVVDEFTEEGDVAKGQSAKSKGDVVDCTFSFEEVSDGSDPEFPAGYTFVGEGEVSGYTTPRS